MPSPFTLDQISSMLATAGSGTPVGQTNMKQVGYLVGLLAADFSSVYVVSTSAYTTAVSSITGLTFQTGAVFSTFALSNGNTF